MTSSSTAFNLSGGMLVPFSSVPGERVRVLCGRVWITEEGNPHDTFLAGGQEVSLTTRGLAVLEALSPARVQRIEPVNARSTVRRLLDFLRGARRQIKATTQLDRRVGLIQRVKVQPRNAGGK